MESKICKQCGETKPISKFRKNGGGRLGVTATCKVCQKERAIKLRTTNIDNGNVKACTMCKQYLPYTKYKLKLSSKDGTENQCYNCKNKASSRKVNYNTKILRYIRNYITSHNDVYLDIVGCNISELVVHLERTAHNNGELDFMIGDCGMKFHIDHITPTSKFNMSNEDDVIKCYHWSNLQILPQYDNCAKGGIKPTPNDIAKQLLEVLDNDIIKELTKLLS